MFSKPTISKIAALFMALSTTACVDATHAEVGRVIGAIGGAIIGSELSGGERDAMIIGGILGAYIGGHIGEDLDYEDERMMSDVVIFVLDHGADGYSKSWRNGHSRHYGHFTAHSTYRTSDRVECRRFTNTIYTSRQPRRSSGTACRHRAGNWSIIR